MKRTITVRETAHRLGCTLKWVYDLLYADKLKAVKQGRRWAISAAAVHKLLTARRGQNE